MRRRLKVEINDKSCEENMIVDNENEDDLPDLDEHGNLKPKKLAQTILNIEYSKERKGPFVVCIRVINGNTSKHVEKPRITYV